MDLDLKLFEMQAMNMCDERSSAMDKDYTLYGTKIFNSKSKEIGLIIYTWKNKFADTVVDYAACVDKNGKRYNIELDLISPMEYCYDSQK